MLSTVEFSISQALGSPREAPTPGFEPGPSGFGDRCAYRYTTSTSVQLERTGPCCVSGGPGAGSWILRSTYLALRLVPNRSRFRTMDPWLHGSVACCRRACVAHNIDPLQPLVLVPELRAGPLG